MGRQLLQRLSARSDQSLRSLMRSIPQEGEISAHESGADDGLPRSKDDTVPQQKHGSGADTVSTTTSESTSSPGAFAYEGSVRVVNNDNTSQLSDISSMDMIPEDISSMDMIPEDCQESSTVEDDTDSQQDGSSTANDSNEGTQAGAARDEPDNTRQVGNRSLGTSQSERSMNTPNVEATLVGENEVGHIRMELDQLRDMISSQYQDAGHLPNSPVERTAVHVVEGIQINQINFGSNSDNVEAQTRKSKASDTDNDSCYRRYRGVTAIACCIYILGCATGLGLYQWLVTNTEEQVENLPEKVDNSTREGDDSLSEEDVWLPNDLVTSSGFCFVDKRQLKDAVDEYLADNSKNTAVAKRYGWPIGEWCVDYVTNFNTLFSCERNVNATYFNEDITMWNVSSATTMNYMFNGVLSFNQDLSLWNVSNVRSMTGTFRKASSFNGNISGWDVSKVTSMLTTFESAISFDRSLSGWNVSRVVSMRGMFSTAEVFNSNLNDWDVSNVKSMRKMFYAALSFNQNLSNWDVSSVTTMDSMFWNSVSFESNGSLASWDVSSVTNMYEMFKSALKFNDDLSKWNVSSVESFHNTFWEATSFKSDLCSWGYLMKNTSDVTEMFHGTSCISQSDPILQMNPSSPLCSTCGM